MRTTILLLGLACVAAAGEQVAGTWHVVTNLNGREVPAVLELRVGQDGALAGTWTSRGQATPLTDVAFADGVLMFVRTMGSRSISFRGTVADGKLEGNHVLGTRKIPATGRRLTEKELNDPEAQFKRTAVRAAPRDGFPVLDDPKMTPAADAQLGDDEYVIGVELNGEAKAYPVRVMGVHEVVNDSCGKEPITASW
jgi:hypothetical protein